MIAKQLLVVLGGVIALSIMEAPLTSGSGDQLPTSAASPVTAVPPGHQMKRNPQLPQHPLGAYTDAQYEAAVAALRSNVAKQYADVLQKLGYQDEQGNFIQGSVETEANRQKSLLQRSMGLAREDVTHQHQQQGTLFSGIRGTDQARAEFPYADQIGQLGVNTPLTLAQLHEQASGLMSDYTIQDNQLLASAAQRAAARIQAQPSAAAPQPGGVVAPAAPPAGGWPMPDYTGGGLAPAAGSTVAGPLGNYISDVYTPSAAPAAAPPINSGILSATQKKLLNMTP